jgi:hypothetical protein
VETGATAEPFRHRQTKGAETDTLGLTSAAPHSYSTVKTIAQGRMIRLYLWFCRVLFVARGPWVRAGTRPSLRPLLISRAVRFQ